MSLRHLFAVVSVVLISGGAITQEVPKPPTPVPPAEDFQSLVKRLQAEKPGFAKRQQDLLAARYDLADRPADGVTMSKGKPVQAGVRVKLSSGTTWDELAGLAPGEIRERKLWPAGFMSR
ncbi:MAG TPA: hypothetical protein VNO53_02410 [Steroidobacteraceae bacterium]|nr:hypothetical protein [Steroidobacteraceae bacterium]